MSWSHSSNISVNTAECNRISSPGHSIPSRLQLIKDLLSYVWCKNRAPYSLSYASQSFTRGAANNRIRICYSTLSLNKHEQILTCNLGQGYFAENFPEIGTDPTLWYWICFSFFTGRNKSRFGRVSRDFLSGILSARTLCIRVNFFELIEAGV